MIFSYSSKRLRRHPSEILLSSLIVCCVTVLLLILQYFQEEQSKRLEDTLDHFEISCAVTNATGSRSYNLNIAPYYLSLCVDEEGALTPYIRDVFMTATLPGASVAYGFGNTETTLLLTNDIEQYPPMKQADLRYVEGHSSLDFQSNEAICVVSDRIYSSLGEQDTIAITWHPNTPPLICQVIGSYYDPTDTVFVPWNTMSLLLQEHAVEYSISSMNFTVADNRRLNETKTAFLEYFLPTSRTNNDSTMMGLVIEDDLFRDTVTVLEREKAMLQAIQILIIFFSVGIVFLVTFLNIRKRKLEFAVMRSLGTGILALYGGVLFEYMIFYLLGISIGVLLLSPLGAVVTSNEVRLLIFFMLCYFIGVTVAFVQSLSGQIMQKLKGKE